MILGCCFLTFVFNATTVKPTESRKSCVNCTRRLETLWLVCEKDIDILVYHDF